MTGMQAWAHADPHEKEKTLQETLEELSVLLASHDGKAGFR